MIVGFNWIVPNKLAGSGRPGLYNEIDDDLSFIRKSNIDCIVNLTETNLDEEFLNEEFDVVHFPIPDMGIPMPKNAYTICTEIKKRMDSGEVVMVHCKAGLGRTGTILACVLVEMNYSPEDAIKEVRRNIRLAIQNSLQENFINNYKKYQMSQLKVES